MRPFAKLVTLQMLRGYKWAISPQFPPACRYVPTCSEYAMEAVERYGAMRGGWMALMRLLRCHPFAPGGYDPVLKSAAPCKEATSFPRGLNPSPIADDSSRRLKRCATQNPNPRNLNGTTLTRGTI
jgi:putative membrane protein insertion efficiency factor